MMPINGTGKLSEQTDQTNSRDQPAVVSKNACTQQYKWKKTFQV